MNLVLWILQVGLAVLFLLHGWLYLVWPTAMVEQLRHRSPKPQQAVSSRSPGFRRFSGVAEGLAAGGLIAPGLTGLLPWLPPRAAFGLMIVMAGAGVYPLRRGETQLVIPTGILFLLVTVVAAMRGPVLPLAACSALQRGLERARSGRFGRPTAEQRREEDPHTPAQCPCSSSPICPPVRLLVVGRFRRSTIGIPRQAVSQDSRMPAPARRHAPRRPGPPHPPRRYPRSAAIGGARGQVA